MDDLWNEQIGEEMPIVSPAVIMKEQATLLGQKTKNIVTATVKRYESDEDLTMGDDFWESDFTYRFTLVARTLGNYRFPLFDITHAISMYPVRFRVFDKVLAQEAFPDTEPEGYPEAEAEGKFRAYLGFILGARRTSDLVRSLLAQAKT